MRKIIELYALLKDIKTVAGSRYFFYLFVLIVTGFLESITLAGIVPLLSALGVGAAGESEVGGIEGYALFVLSWIGFEPNLYSLSLIIFFALFVSTLSFLLHSYLGSDLQTRYVYRWQTKLIRNIWGAKWQLFLDVKDGVLINSVISECQRLGGAYYQMGLLLTGIFHGAMYMLMAALLSGTTTVLILVAGISLFMLTRPLIKRAYKIGVGISSGSAELQSLTGEFVAGAKLLKATGTEDKAIKLLGDVTNKLRQNYKYNSFDVQLAKGVFDFGAAFIVALILVASGPLLGIDIAITLVILALFIRLVPKLTGLQQSIQSLTVSLSAVRAVQGLDKLTSEYSERGCHEGYHLRSKDPFHILLSDVYVRRGGRDVIKALNVELLPGSCTAIVGGSGAGKSTLLDVILGLVDTKKGEIKINGYPLADLSISQLRSRIGYMGQETVLYNASIRDNLVWGSKDIDDNSIWKALSAAAADSFVRDLPDGLDTQVGDHGSLLSGGQKQRIGLARALLASPSLLVLDEATSALDAEAERIVSDAIERLKGKVTILIVAHRLSSIRVADHVLVLEQGKLVESGSFSKLLSIGGRFESLWGMQQGGIENRVEE